MTDYDARIRSTEITEEELPALVACLAEVAHADGVFSEDERTFLANCALFPSRAGEDGLWQRMGRDCFLGKQDRMP